MLAEAQQAGDAYNQAVHGADNDLFAAALPWEVRDKMNTFHIIPQYQESVDGLLIPQFFQVIPQSLFTDGDKVLLSKEQLAAMEKAPPGFAAKIRAKIESLLEQHYQKTFFTWLDRGKIVCEPSYRLPSAIHPINSTAIYGRSLYEAEEDMNTLEQDLVKRLTAVPNVLWWHRNIARHGFAINGYFNHYPDIMIMTQSGKIVLAETKGEHLKNDDSLEKIEPGAAWRNAAGNRYRYYMVFRDEENLPHGAVSMGQFLETVRAL